MHDGAGPLTKPLLFLASYAPLFGLLAIRFREHDLRLACIGLALAGPVLIGLVVYTNARPAAATFTVTSVGSGGNDAAGYLAGYLLPFLTVSQPKPQDLVAYGTFLLVAGVIHCRTNAIQVNPMFLLLGWRITAVQAEGGFSGFLITNRPVLPGDTVRTSRLANDVLLRRPDRPAP